MWTSKDARDIPPDYLNHVCHPGRRIGVVNCIICDSGFCKSEFVRKVLEGNGFFISRHDIVCHAHPNLTFEVFKTCDHTAADIDVLNAQKKILILQKHLENIKNGLNVTNSLDKEDMDLGTNNDDDEIASITSDNSVKKRKCEAFSECHDCQIYIKDLNNERRLNEELIKHNNELREHNYFLRSIAGNAGKCNVNSNITNASTYASTVANFSQKQEFARISIKPVASFKGDVLDIIKQQVSSKTNAKVLKINKSNNGSIFLKCNSEKDSLDILNVLKTENKGILTAETFNKKNPQIRITNISEKINENEITKDIITRNQLPDDSIKILHMYRQKNNNYAVLAEVTSDAYLIIMKNKSVFIGYENCRVYDNFNIKLCKNCCGFNHSLTKCKEQFKRPQSCSKCSGNHEITNCTSDIKKCVNCLNANRYLIKKRTVDHSSDDIDKCESFKVRWEQLINDTNYPFKPDPPFKSNRNISNNLIQV